LGSEILFSTSIAPDNRNRTPRSQTNNKTPATFPGTASALAEIMDQEAWPNESPSRKQVTHRT
jgi:hypothetical protein